MNDKVESLMHTVPCPPPEKEYAENINAFSRGGIARLVRVYGIVQGVGFRPFVSRIASGAKIAGSVCNKGPFVEIYAKGSKEQVNDFLHRLTALAPERSAILKVETEEISDDEWIKAMSGIKRDEKIFHIIESEKVTGDIFVSPDIATCGKCQAELFDPQNRRYLHPFINCTACGPRLTILDSMPYDRVRTSMKDFPMCQKCEWEYTEPSTRRYHAQPVCCNSCGPRLIIIRPAGLRGVKNDEAIIMARDAVRSGGIIAIKGIGGFHLCCDAANFDAVRRLRKLKERPKKPFAVMMRDIEAVRRECEITSEKEEAILTGPNKPILLLNRKNGGLLSPDIAPDNPRVGVMLPYAPVQMLLFDYPDGKPFPSSLVMTSGNPRGAPICRTDEDALEALSPMASLILSNDRTIRLRADDSVMAWDNEREMPAMIRRSRGYAPLPIMLDIARKTQSDSTKRATSAASILAIGGELKNTFCLSRGGLYYLSPYIGDMADVRSAAALRSAITRMERLLEITPKRIVCDKHPLYNTAAAAKEIAAERGIPLLQVQHHWAHVASCMAENGLKEGTVIGAAFDGTGYGDDGTIWGGEILVCNYAESRRAISIEPFSQAGGDLSSRQGWRIACALLDDDAVRALHLANDAELSSVRFMIKEHINTVTSTSCGRLFDAVSAILGFCRESSFEGEAAMRVQAAAEEAVKEKECGKEKETASKKQFKEQAASGLELCAPYAPKKTGGHLVMPTAKLVRGIARRRMAGESAPRLAYFFHDALSRMTAAACQYCRENSASYGGNGALNTAALTGGVFNNMLFRSLCRKRLEEAGFNVLVHTLVPSGDGGIALGQAVIGNNT